jgi:hypothetical protein
LSKITASKHLIKQKKLNEFLLLNLSRPDLKASTDCRAVCESENWRRYLVRFMMMMFSLQTTTSKASMCYLLICIQRFCMAHAFVYYLSKPLQIVFCNFDWWHQIATQTFHFMQFHFLLISTDVHFRRNIQQWKLF